MLCPEMTFSGVALRRHLRRVRHPGDEARPVRAESRLRISLVQLRSGVTSSLAFPLRVSVAPFLQVDITVLAFLFFLDLALYSE